MPVATDVSPVLLLPDQELDVQQKETIDEPIHISISNKDVIFGEIDELISTLSSTSQEKRIVKPPAVEYLFVEPYSSFSLFGSLGFGFNPYGHAAIRYTMPKTGEQKVVNISGTQSDNLVNFYSPVDYIFENTHKGDQGGIWNRNIASVRIEEVEEWQIEDMDYYYSKLHRKNKAHRSAKFSIIFSPIYNMIRWVCSFSKIAERGNCAYFTSSGLAEGSLLSFPTLWPKKIWLELFEIEKNKNPDNVHVVYYRRNRNDGALKYGVDASHIPLAGVSPISPLRSFMYYNLEQFADVIVEVPPGKNIAEIRAQEHPKKNSKIRYYAGTALLGIGILAFFASSRGRKKVVKGVDSTQTKLKHARELVNLFKQHRRDALTKKQEKSENEQKKK